MTTNASVVQVAERSAATTSLSTPNCTVPSLSRQPGVECNAPLQGVLGSPEKVSAVGCSLLTRGGAGWRKRSRARTAGATRSTTVLNSPFSPSSRSDACNLMLGKKKEQCRQCVENKTAGRISAGRAQAERQLTQCTAVPVATVCLGRV